MQLLIELGLLVLVGFLVWKLHLKQPLGSQYLNNEIVRLRQDLISATENIGGLQTLLSSKEKDLFAITQHSQELEAKLVQEEENNKRILSQKKSSEVRTGHIAECLAPLMLEGHDLRNVRWLGMPIDYISFGRDNICFIEVKSGNSHLSHNQKHIKRLVEEGKIKWQEIRVRGNNKK